MLRTRPVKFTNESKSPFIVCLPWGTATSNPVNILIHRLGSVNSGHRSLIYSSLSCITRQPMSEFHKPLKNTYTIRMNFLDTPNECADVRCLPPRGYPASATSRTRSYSELGGSDHSGFYRNTETHAIQEDPYQAGKRRKVDNRLIVASTTALQDNLNRQRVPNNLETETQISYPTNERFYQDRQTYEVIDNRFIPAFSPRYPHYIIQDINMGETHDFDNSFPREHRDLHAMTRKPRTRESNSASLNGDEQPLLLWRPGDKQRFDDSDQHILGYANANRLQDERRHDIDNGYKHTVASQPSSSIHTDSLQRDMVTYGSKPIPHLLWAPEDKQHLTDLHCFVRKYCIYVFCATRQDVESKSSDQYISFCASLEAYSIHLFRF